MKITLLMLLTCIFIQAQDNRFGTLKIRKEYPVVNIPSHFSNDTVSKNEFFVDSLLDKGVVTKVKYYYSTYALSPDFDQEALNKRRKAELLERYPELDNPLIEWEEVPQDDCDSPESCKDLFHGFKIEFREMSTADNPADEVAYLDSVFHYLNQKDSIDKGLMPKEQTRVMKSIWDDRVGWIPDTSSRAKIIIKKPTDLGADETVLRAIKRNQWDSVVYVIDVTASMSPYTSQVMYWLKSSDDSNKVRCFTFFNDGDGKDNSKKKIGSTGGIHHYEGSDFNKMFKAMRGAMNINSKDVQENDAEGIIEAIKKFPDCKEIVLIADNYSPVRDFVLFNQINRPVRIILCGCANGRINPQYIHLALLTGGSLHLEGKDIEVPQVNVGDVFEINGYFYKLEEDKVIEL